MRFKIKIIEELKKYDKIFSKANQDDLEKGRIISTSVKEFDHPEFYLNEHDLLLLSQYYTYVGICNSKKPLAKEDEYNFDED